MRATYRQSQFWFRLSLFIGLPIFAWMMTAEAQFTNPVTRVEYLSTSSLQFFPMMTAEAQFTNPITRYELGTLAQLIVGV